MAMHTVIAYSLYHLLAYYTPGGNSLPPLTNSLLSGSLLHLSSAGSPLVAINSLYDPLAMPLEAVHSLYHLLAYYTPGSNPLSLQPTGYTPSGSLLHLTSAGSALGGNLLPLRPTGYAPSGSLLHLTSAGSALGGNLLPLRPTGYAPSGSLLHLSSALNSLYDPLAMSLVAIHSLYHLLAYYTPGSNPLSLQPTGYTLVAVYFI